MDDRLVFVVHGRNTKVKEAMFVLLRALGLKPIEWEQAAALTEKGSPTTLEVVQAGIRAARCVLVLLTGDDQAILVREFREAGEESAALQPRPNVIFEMGLALEHAGADRTVVVHFEPLRIISDINGINVVFLDNTATRRKALVERLKSAGCAVDDSGSDYLSQERGGDFMAGAARPRAPTGETYEQALDRGKFTEFVADSVFSFNMSNIDLDKELFSDLKRSVRLDLKYHYLGTACARNWIDLSQHPDYGHSELRSAIDEHSEEMIAACRFGDTTVDLISLGPGDGSIDTRLLYKLDRMATVGYYYCIDISFDLLQHAVANIVRAGFLRRDIRIKAIHGDFTQLERLSSIYTFDPSVNLFALNGYTLGNHNEAELLRALRDGMLDGDFLFLDARLHRFAEWNGTRPLSQSEREDLLRGYSHDLNNRFAFGPVEATTSSIASQVTFKYDVNNRVTVVPRALNIITYCTDMKTEMRQSREPIQRPRLELAATTLYSFDVLRDWLPTRGFELVWSAQARSAGLFLLQKVA